MLQADIRPRLTDLVVHHQQVREGERRRHIQKREGDSELRRSRPRRIVFGGVVLVFRNVLFLDNFFFVVQAVVVIVVFFASGHARPQAEKPRDRIILDCCGCREGIQEIWRIRHQESAFLAGKRRFFLMNGATKTMHEEG
ncbi:MAG: hypothetical protein U0744_21725 [Gemmataceae bacterium]